MPYPLDILLVALGSHGDVHPFVGIGLALRSRGHRVRVLANPFFESLLRDVDLELIPIGTEQQYRELTSDPDLWRGTRGSRKVFESVGLLMRPVYDAIAEHNVPGRTIVAGSSLALGARVAQEKLGIPTTTVHLQPSIFWSNHRPPVLPGVPSWLPRPLQRLVYLAGSTLVIDPLVLPGLNAFRAELGLRPVRRVMSWWHSPTSVIGLFPAWFAPPQPDWPPHTTVTGFPLFDERGLLGLEPSLVKFLDEGDRPIAFTPGSAMWSAEKFFTESTRACELLGCRGLLLTRHLDHVPKSLPPGVRHVAYAPFSELLPRCAAIVHHGGIGTSAQALAAGLPQLVMPFAHDQPDNAQRLRHLNVARVLPATRYTARAAARRLNELLQSTDVQDACRKAAAHFPDAQAIPRTCELIEELATTSSGAAVPAAG